VLVTVHPAYDVWQDDFRPYFGEALTDKNGRYEGIEILRLPDISDGGRINSRTPFCIMARSVGRNLVAIHEFTGNPSNIDLQLQPGITLSGFVKDTKGAPVTNALVNLRFASAGAMRKLGPHPIKVDAQGAFSIPALPQGRDYQFLEQLGFPPAGVGGRNIELEGITAKGYGAASGYLIDALTHTNHYEFPAFVLNPADRKLAGQVLDSNLKPLPGASVWIASPTQPDISPITTDAQGNFMFDAVCAGSLRLFVMGHTGGRERQPGAATGLEVQAGDTNVRVVMVKATH